MKALLVLSAVILAACAAPEGYYRQEYQFKKSSATYKNNQLETKNDHEGFYGNQGNLTGHTAPKVEQHNQHSEFISPSVDNMGHSLTTYNDRDLTDKAESAFRNHNILPGTNRQYAHSSSSNQLYAQRGTLSAGSYSPTSSSQANLWQITQNLQYDMEKQVREALRSMQSQYQYGSQMRGEDMQYLENQLRSNITRQLQQSLQTNNGASRGHSYSTSGSYDSTELNNLRQQMETALIKQLHKGARTSYSQSASGSSSNSWNTYRSNSEVDDLSVHGQHPVPISSYYRPVPYNPRNDLQRPEKIRHVTVTQPAYSQIGSRDYPSSYDRDFPTLSQSQITVNPTKRISEVMQDVQNQVTELVRQALYNTNQAKYSILERVKTLFQKCVYMNHIKTRGNNNNSEKWIKIDVTIKPNFLTV